MRLTSSADFRTLWHTTLILFAEGSSTITPMGKREIEQYVHTWHSRLSLFRPGEVRVDGYASVDGEVEVNWKLSCDRAQAVVGELTAPSSGSPGIPAG